MKLLLDGGVPVRKMLLSVNAHLHWAESACCVYIRRETGGKTIGVMQMTNRFFTGNTIYVVVILNFARR